MLWDAADCLARFNELAARPTTDAITADNKYKRLARAEQRVISDIAAVFPQALYPKVGYASIPTLSTSDGGQTFTFGTDAEGNAIAPVGKTEIYPSLESIPDSPWVEGVDYLWETTQIRIPNNRSWSGTLYYRGVVFPTPLAADEEPHLDPAAARELIVVEAVRQFAAEGARNPALAALMRDEYDNRLWPRYAHLWRTAYSSGGALIAYTGRDLAILSQ